MVWHLRQRDTTRALRLAEEVQPLLSILSPSQSALTGARLTLARAEARFLMAELVDAQRLALDALATFTEQADWCGVADVHWLLAWVAIDSGQIERSDSALDAMITHAHRAGDPMRIGLAEAVTARMLVLRDPKAAQARWGATVGLEELHHHAGVQMWRTDYLCLQTLFRGDSGGSARLGIAAYELALASGQVRAAIICCTNTAENFGRLNDFQQSLDWAQRGLDLARKTNWPRSVGGCLMHTAEIMRQLGNWDTAQEMLEEALITLAPLAGARPYSITLQYQGELALDRKDYAAALQAFERLENKALELHQHDFRIDSQRGQAHALAHRGLPEQALKKAHAALDTAAAQGDVIRQVDALMVLAEIHNLHPGLKAEPEPATGAPLHYLQRALAATRSVAGYTVTGKLLEALSHAYAREGDFVQAHEAAMQALAARDKTHNQQTTNRAVAMQVLRQTEQARVEGDYLRQLASAEAGRAAVLQRTTATLESLSTVGQEITQHLNAQTIFEVLYTHLQALLDVTAFAIYLQPAQADGTLVLMYGREQGKILPRISIAITDSTSHTAKCFRERRDFAGDPGQALRVEGTAFTESALFAPLIVNERVLGVITVQSEKALAYEARDHLIFRTLSAYAAIALDNAQTYQRLEDAQQQLLEQQKMAALGSLVAGVAHELNTPIGNCIMTASTVSDKLREVQDQFERGTLRRSDMASFLKDSVDASELILRGLNTSARLVASFKQVAVDRTTAHRRQFALEEYLLQLVATMQNRLKASGHSIETIVTSEIVMDSYPGPLGQVVSNLINNAIVHAYPNRMGGKLCLHAQEVGNEQVVIQFSDDGDGIADAHMPKIFEPFFTTKMGQGGSGLGLSISYNIVSSLLGGTISVHSRSGEGTRFTITLPLAVPM